MNKKNLTKVELRAILEGYKDTVTDKSLKDRIGYTLNKYSESTKKTVLDLIEDIEQALTPAPLPIENSAKPTLKKSGKKSTPKKVEVEEEPEVTEEEATEPEPKEVKEEPKKSPKKTTKGNGKSKPNVSKPKITKGATENSLPMAAIFPEKIEDENIGTLVAVPHKYHTVKDLREALEKGDKTIVICAYYPMALIMKHGYSYMDVCDARIPKKGFAHDLDIQQVIYTCEGMPVAYALSDYTECMFMYEENMLTPVETKDNETGDIVKTRFANGCEFEFYEVVGEAE